jgi:hypothetical protein
MRRDGSCLLAAALALAVSSPSLADRLARSVVPGGGFVEAASQSYRLSSALGQPMTGRCASEGYVLSCGFWGVPPATVPVAVEPAASPEAFRLLGIQPNPSASEAAIVFDLPATAHVEVRVFDVAGRLIQTLAMERWERGRHVLHWDGRNDSGAPVAAGIYVIHVTTGSDRALTKFVRLR